MNQKSYSIKQMADELGVSKQRVYRCIKKQCISEAHREVVNGNNVMMYDYDTFLKISKFIELSTSFDEAHREAHREAVEQPFQPDNQPKNDSDLLREVLLKQIEEKDQQIRKLTEELNKVHQLLDQEQQLRLISEQNILKLEEEKKKESPKEVVEQSEQQPEKISFWSRIFKF